MNIQTETMSSSYSPAVCASLKAETFPSEIPISPSPYALNNEGIDALIRGDFDTATAKLAEAIRLMRGFLGTVDPKTPESSSISFIDGCSEISLGNLYGSQRIIYNNVIRMPIPSSSRENCHEHDAKFITAVIIFNLALVFHVRAESGDLASINKACKFYEMVMGLFNQAPGLVASHRLLVLLKLAAMNNRLMIQRDMAPLNIFLALRQQEMTHISSFVGQHVGMDNDFWTEHEIQALLMNIFLIQPSSVAAAA